MQTFKRWTVLFQIYITKTEISCSKCAIWRNGPGKPFLTLGLMSSWMMHSLFLLCRREFQHDKCVYQSLCGRLDNPWKMRVNASCGSYLLPSVLSDQWFVYGLLTVYLCGKPQPQKCRHLEDSSSKTCWKNAELWIF